MTSVDRQKPCRHEDYCVHRLYEKCRDERVRNIAELFPLRHVETQVNATMKFTNPYKSNIPTLACQKYILQELDIERDENFVKDFYANPQTQLKEDINIIDLAEKQMAANNAYVLREVEKVEFRERERLRVNTITKTRNQAIRHFNEYFEEDKKGDAEDKQQNKAYLKRLYTKLEQVADHIVHGGGETQTDREKEFLMGKEYLNSGYLAGIKIKKPKNAIEILEEIRVLLQKHKLKHANEREQMEGNRSMTQSQMTEASMQSNDSQSRISQASGVEASQIAGEDSLINKYCDMVALQKKWKKSNIDEVKQVIRRAVMNKVLLHAQKKALKDRLKQNQINISLKKQNPDLAKKLKQKQMRAKSALKKKGSEPQPSIDRKPSAGEPATTLPKVEQDIKLQWMSTGRYNPAGELFEKTNNYSRLFTKKLQDLAFNFELKETQDDLDKTGDGGCTCTCKCPCES